MDEDLLNSINDLDNSMAVQTEPAPAPAPVQAAPQPAPVPTPSFQPTPFAATPKKKTNKLTVLFAILTLIGFSGTGVFATLYFMNQNKPAAKDEPTAPIVSYEEEELTDTEKIAGLDQVLSSLFGSTTESRTMETTDSNFAEVPLFVNGSVSSDESVAITLMSLGTEGAIAPTEDELASAKELLESEYPGVSTDTIGNFYSADSVVAEHNRLFGVEPADRSSAAGGTFLYDETTNLYIDIKDFDSTDFHRYYYKSRYSHTGDIAHVYISAAMQNSSENKIYCIPVIPSATLTPSVCEESPETPFTLNDSNYSKYASARFDFAEKATGEYYFIGGTSGAASIE